MEDYLTELTFMRFELYELILHIYFHAQDESILLSARNSNFFTNLKCTTFKKYFQSLYITQILFKLMYFNILSLEFKKTF